MSKHTRALILGVTLAAMNLAGMTAVAQAQTSDVPASNQNARRPPTERQVGEPYRNYHEALAAQTQTAQDDAVERFRRGERTSQKQPTIADNTRRSPTEAQVGESWRHPVNVPVQPGEPSGQSGWLVLTLGVLSAALALVAGLAVLAARRASRRLRAGHAA
jgi:hypothetical protein